MLGEVVVTARKSTENLQKAPASITALSAVQLAQQGITTPQSLEKVVPSSNIRTEGAVVQPFIRGVGSNIDVPYVDPGVSFTLNGVNIPRYGTFGQLFDLDNVQVISGPQGTLYGGTAAGGAINLNTKRPSHDDSGDGSIETGSYALVHAAIAQDFTINDELAFRGAVDYDRHDGYESRGFDSDNTIKGRASLLFTPDPNLTALVTLTGIHAAGTLPAAVNVPLKDSSNPWNVPAQGAIFGNPLDPNLSGRNNNTFILSANIEYRLGKSTFTYIPGFSHIEDRYGEFAGDLPFRFFDLENQHTEELRYSYHDGPLLFTAGAYYYRDIIDFKFFLGAPVLPFPPYLVTIPILLDPHQIDQGYAGYTQLVYSVVPSLRLTVGGRYSEDQRNSTGIGLVGAADLPYTFNRTKHHIDWKVGADYDLTPRVLLYANVQTGYLPVAFAPIPNTPDQSNYVPPERLLAFSGGVKSRFLDNRLEVNDEVYYYEYQNYQVVDFNAATGITNILPARNSRIYGDELSLRVILPLSSEFTTGVNLMSAEYQDFQGPGYDYSGLQMIDAPTTNLNASLQHKIDLPNGASVRGRVSTHYESGHWGQFDHATDTHQPAYTKTDLSVIYEPARARWTLEAYARNLENAATFGALDVGGQPGPATGFLEAPRTFGVRFSAHWGG